VYVCPRVCVCASCVLRECVYVVSLTLVLLPCSSSTQHHPLTRDADVYELLPSIGLPIDELISDVTDLIEDEERRIVGVDRRTSSFIVYCPTVSSLRNLWAMCDRINAGLVKHVVGNGNDVIEAPLMRKFNLLAADVQTTISGPQYLIYKNQLVKLGKNL